MFHVNAWGLPYAACMNGAKLVFPGPGLDGKSLYELFEVRRRSPVSAGVPTVWQALLAYVDSQRVEVQHHAAQRHRRQRPAPPAMLRKFGDVYDVRVLHAWGMTEMSPVGTVAGFKPRHLPA